MLTAVVEEQGFGSAPALVVAGAWTDGVDRAPIAFECWMDFGVAIALAGGGLEDLRAGALREPQHVDFAMHAGFGGLHRVLLIVDR